MKALTIGQQPTVVQKEILLDISEIAWAIEEEFGEVFKPYAAGWYHQLDGDNPSMPDMIGTKWQIYHSKGGDVDAPWGEKITMVTDPNTASGSIYNEDCDMVVTIRAIDVSKKHPYAERNVFSRRPRVPVRGAEVVREYVSWIIDHSCEWQPLDVPFEQYAKHLIDNIQIEAASVVEVNRELQHPDFGKIHTDGPLRGQPKIRPGEINDTHLPSVLHRNILFEQLKERLQFYSSPLRQTLDAFIGSSTWDTYSVDFRGHHSLHLRKLGDFRVLEWERLKKEGRI